MNMNNRRPILSNTEKYSQKAQPQRKNQGNKKIPYSFPEARRRLFPKLKSTLQRSMSLPVEARPNNIVITKMTLHPAYLAKSFFPNSLFKEYNLRSLGSKEVFIHPEVQVTESKSDNISSSQYFVAGKEIDIIRLISDIESEHVEAEIQYDFAKFEDIDLIKREDKIVPSAYVSTPPVHVQQDLKYEIVLHASLHDEDVISSFISYVENLDGLVYAEKTRTVKGLTFCFISIASSKIPSLADFSFIRVVRPAPELKISESINAQLENSEPSQLGGTEGSANNNEHSNIAIFDGGLFAEDCNRKEIRYFDLTHQSQDIKENYQHGSLVTSAVVYGEASDYSNSNNFVLNVDHYKVICGRDRLDIGLVNVLDRIVSVLKTKKYKFANISLGPEVPCPDDEPSLWTATLDEIAADGDVLIVVAVGNTGKYFETEDKDLARIQSPADILNGISIGASNSKDKGWKRASYSCVGPGRRPGYVKPDALYFGGDEHLKLELINMRSYDINPIYGTSFAAPLVTRTAALIDRATKGELNVATIRALLIHSTGKNNANKAECGWGLINGNIEDILYCSDSKVTFIYQGALESASGVRAAVPFPAKLTSLPGKIELDATLCFYTDVDQQHTVSYTRAGVDVTFRPNFHKYKGESDIAHTRPLFSKKKILGDEATLRRDAHKWETCYKVHDSLMTSSLKDPIFDIRYLTRDEGHGRSPGEMRKLAPLQYSLVVTINHNKGYNIYDDIRNHYSALVPLDIQIDASIKV